MDKQTLLTILLSVFIALLGVGIIVPIMPVFASELGAGGFALGMIIAAFSVSRGILQPVVGSMSDRWGRKGFLVTGLFVYGLVGLLIPQASHVNHLIIIRMFHGIGSAMIVPIALAYISSLAPTGQEGKYMGYLNIAIFTGIGCGPVIGGLFSDLWGFSSVFYIMALLSFLAFGLVIKHLPVQPSKESPNQLGLGRNLVLMFRRKRTRGILIARFATMIIMVPTMAFLPLLMSGWDNVSGLQIGLVIAGRTLVNASLQIPFGKAADRYNKTYLLATGATCMSMTVLTIPLVQTFPMMLILYIILGIGESITWPVLGAYASEEGRNHYGHGTMMGVFSLAMSGGVFSGALLAGFSMDTWGIQYSFYVTAAIVLIVTLIATIMIQQHDCNVRKLHDHEPNHTYTA